MSLTPCSSTARPRPLSLEALEARIAPAIISAQLVDGWLSLVSNGGSDVIKVGYEPLATKPFYVDYGNDGSADLFYSRGEVTQFNFDGGGGDDVLLIDASTSSELARIGITFNAGGNLGDRLIIKGQATDTLQVLPNKTALGDQAYAGYLTLQQGGGLWDYSGVAEVQLGSLQAIQFGGAAETSFNTGTNQTISATGLSYQFAGTLQKFSFAQVNSLLFITHGSSVSMADTVSVTGLPAGLTELIIRTGQGDDTLLLAPNLSFGSLARFEFGGEDGNDKLEYLADTNFVLANSGLFAGSAKVNLNRVEVANLTGGPSATSFDVSGWTGTGRLTGGGAPFGEVDQVTHQLPEAPFGSNSTTSLGANTLSSSTGLSLQLVNIDKVSLSNAAANLATFEINDFPGAVDINEARGGSYNTLKISADRSFKFEGETILRDGWQPVRAFDVQSIQLTGGAGANRFELGSWVGDLAVQGGGGLDTVAIAADANFTLSDSSLSYSFFPVALSGIEQAELTGGASDNVFHLQNWTGAARLDGAGGTDHLKSTANAAFQKLTNTSLERAGAGTVVLASIEQAELIGGTGDNSFDVSGFGVPGQAFVVANSVNGGGGNDTVLDSRSVDFTNWASYFERVGDLESLDLRGVVSSTILLNLASVKVLTGEDRTLTILGDQDDRVGIGLGWTLGEPQTDGEMTFAVYQQDRMTLRVAQPTKVFTATAMVDAKHPFRFQDADGDSVQVKLKGKGSAQVLLAEGKLTGAALEDVRLTGTDAKSAFSITVTRNKASGDGAVKLQNLRVAGNLGTLAAATTDLGSGGMQVTGTLGILALRDVLHGNLFTEGTAAQPLQVSLRNFLGDSLFTLQPISKLQAARLDSGLITAASFKTITVSSGPLAAQVESLGAVQSVVVKGTFSGSLVAGSFNTVTVSGGDFTGSISAMGKIGSISVLGTKAGGGGNVAQATVTAAAVAKFNVAKDVVDLLLLAGANLGADGALGGDDDAFAAGTLGAVTIGGSVSGRTVVAAGLGTINSTFKDGDDYFVDAPKSTFTNLVVGGTVADESLFATGSFGKAPKIGKTTINPATDPRFKIAGAAS